MQSRALIRYSNLFQSEISDSGVLANIPFYKSERDTFTFQSRANRLDVAPDQGEFEDLYDVQFALNYTRTFEDKKSLSFIPAFGSASNKPFKSFDVDTVSFTSTYSFPSSEASTWMFLLNYSNNRPFLNNIPLPGFAYTYAPHKGFRLTLGAPFASIFYQFDEHWSFLGFIIAPWVAKAQFGYTIVGPIQAFSGIDFSQKTFLQFDRANSKERIYYDEKKAFLGIRSPLSKVFFAELEGGLSIGRRFFFGESYTRSPPFAYEYGTSGYFKVSISATLWN